MLGRGKKTIEWDRLRPKLKQRFAAIHLVTCEFRFEGCWKYTGLTFAHAKKRRFLTPEELEVVALACINCHMILDAMSHKKMYNAVMGAIEKRICQP
jgi:hypothetical protein